MSKTREKDELTKAQEAVKKGERVRLLWELLMESVGTTYENTFQETGIKMRDIQEEYNKGIAFIESILKNTPKK